MVAVLGLLASASRRGTLPPDALLFAAVWTALFVVASLLGGVYMTDPTPVLLVAANLALWGIGYFLIFTAPGRPTASFAEAELEFPLLGKFIVISALIGMISPILFAQRLGVDFSQVTDLNQYFDTVSTANSEIRQQVVEEGFLSKICVSFNLAAAVALGIYLATQHTSRYDKILKVLLVVFPGILTTASTSVRSSTLMPIIFIVSGYIAGQVLTQRHRNLLTVRNVARVTIFVLLFSIFVVFFQMIRLGTVGTYVIASTLNHLRPWVAGYLPAFSGWYNRSWDGSLALGLNTFHGVANAFGVEGEGISQYLTGWYIGNGQSSNAATVIRVFVADFGIVGSLIFCFAWGAASAWLSRSTARLSNVALPLLAVNIATIIWSPDGWLLGYGSRLLSIFVLLAYFGLAPRVRFRDPTPAYG
jgi:oligosaccharide repeat unit polymerase